MEDKSIHHIEYSDDATVSTHRNETAVANDDHREEFKKDIEEPVDMHAHEFAY